MTRTLRITVLYLRDVYLCTGELSEAQKEELERQKVMSRQQGAELDELRQQMAKLSTIVDKQAEEITHHNTELK